MCLLQTSSWAEDSGAAMLGTECLTGDEAEVNGVSRSFSPSLVTFGVHHLCLD